MSDEKMREVYKGLSRIEDSFKITKTCFEFRPIYVWLNEHIDAHFATCFLALVLIRLLELKLGRKYPVKRILQSLKDYNCVKLDANILQFTYYDEILEACGKELNMELNNKYRTRQEIQRLLHY